MNIEKLLKNLVITVADFHLNKQAFIKGIAYDSRKVGQDYLFVALKGHTLNGHKFINHAIKQGAIVVVAEKTEDNLPKPYNIPLIQVPDSRRALSQLAATYYGHPYRGLNLIGITGTNGKTSITYIMESILLAAGNRPGIIGTISYRFQNYTQEAPTTTPESLELMRILREIADKGATDVVMEVSSHALRQGRVSKCPFTSAIFTNLTRDHLDYHSSMDDYYEAKSILFRELGKDNNGSTPTAIINIDDPYGKKLCHLVSVPVITYGLDNQSNVRATHLEVNRNGLKFKMTTPKGIMDIKSSLIGDFNVYNILAASATALSMGINQSDIKKGIANLKGIPGRLEIIHNSNSLFVVVDYAHTPDALLKAILSLKPLIHGRIITVFGCGGDRDKGKRFDMGQIAGQYSQVVIITSDNPRTEEPLSIISGIEKGIKDSKLQIISPDGSTKRGYIIEPDRRSAICLAISMADKDDLVLIAGKGHEDYQIIGYQKRPFDDRNEVAQAIMGCK